MEMIVVLALICFSSINDNEDDGTVEFRKCVRVLADRVGFLSRHREELLDKYPKVEAANEQLRKELEDKKDLVKTLYTKHQLEKQVIDIGIFCSNIYIYIYIFVSSFLDLPVVQDTCACILLCSVA